MRVESLEYKLEKEERLQLLHPFNRSVDRAKVRRDPYVFEMRTERLIWTV